jgi:hypothetical protein
MSPGVNFTNILRPDVLYRSFCVAFMCLQLVLVIFWQKDFGAKPANKMLVKLTPGGSMGPSYIPQFLLSEKSQAY